MKVMKIEMQVVVQDDSFEPGQCRKCPIKHVTGSENAMRVWEETVTCGVKCTPATCPMRPGKD